MTTIQIIIVVAVLAVVVVALAVSGGGPRITQITRTVKRDDDKDDNK